MCVSIDKMSQISETPGEGGVAGHNAAVHKGAVVMLQRIHLKQIQLGRDDHLELNAVMITDY
jgi:hypothetical protein